MTHSLLLLTLTLAPLAMGQSLKIPPSVEKLGQKASESVDVTLDGLMLKFAQEAVGDHDEEAKRLMRGLKSIRVRSFEFDNEGEYVAADVETMRSQLNGPGWSKIAQVVSRKDKENVDVFLRIANSQIEGVVVLVAGAKELTIVDIDGQIKPEDVGKLGGRAGIPRLDLRFGERSKK
ncbi:MAG: DUF4252 domain-containing protein [Bryobacteraceae bacterium]